MQRLVLGLQGKFYKNNLKDETISFFAYIIIEKVLFLQKN